MHYITLPIQAGNPKAIQNTINKYVQKVDAFEIWIDHLSNQYQTSEQIQLLFQMLCKIKKNRKKVPLLAVCKNPEEKGKFQQSDESKAELLIAAIQGGAKWADAGMHTSPKQIQQLSEAIEKQQAKNRSCSPKLIISYHNFTETPSRKSLNSIVAKINRHKTDIIKIATMVKKEEEEEDNTTLIELAADLSRNKQKHIIIGMGKKGKITRVNSKKMGNEMCFVSASSSTAPGQLTIEQANQL
jgi:3-dehydroquinate dehydratase I